MNGRIVSVGVIALMLVVDASWTVARIAQADDSANYRIVNTTTVTDTRGAWRQKSCGGSIGQVKVPHRIAGAATSSTGLLCAKQPRIRVNR